ncbi:MAG: Transketolase 1 [Alphaproteobacteria bacterium MarineAlpha9_Bin3]|nr:MAG: Transketolase 1 [Alphaproteobacteria bacterium MarineAlpha9_Bin3]|tara:strand:+ start:12876 stop:14867 length:1992 start_codon:yes stop_codon:yes gene_type:complete
MIENNEKELDKLSNAIRMLSVEAVQRANSGHPGMPMGMADVATVLFTKFLNFDSSYPDWLNRDRFILSAGHGSMLLYSLLYLNGYKDIDIEDIKNFRALHSKTAGHPEYGELSGIETTTGPLGQGIANAVGVALAEKIMSAKYGNDLFNHNTYVIAGDGCLMEGISQEAISLAGHLGLGKLIILFDDNGISIDGPTSLSTSDNQLLRFEASNWHTLECDGHASKDIESAIKKSLNDPRPSLIACKTKIGFGSPNKEGKSSSHGAPMGEEEIQLIRERLGWDYESFDIPEEILSSWRKNGSRGSDIRLAWQNKYMKSAYYEEVSDLIANKHILNIEDNLENYKENLSKDNTSVATRKSSENVLNELTEKFSNLIGGSADLTGSNNTLSKNQKAINANDFSGSYIYYGIREHAMAAVMNGIALHSGLIPYGGTFLVFTDYCRPSIRLSALMGLRVIYIMTHDSIGLGEDGPTHQPVEHLSALRAIPNLDVFRPADSTETLEVWQAALKSKNTPSIIALSRQNLSPVRTKFSKENLSELGAYILVDKIEADICLYASGSEVEIAINASKKLDLENINAKVVSVPSLDRFYKQDKSYKDNIINSIPKIVIEAGIRQSWDYILNENDIFIGMSSFGASAPAKDLYEYFSITEEKVISSAKSILNRRKK